MGPTTNRKWIRDPARDMDTYPLQSGILLEGSHDAQRSRSWVPPHQLLGRSRPEPTKRSSNTGSLTLLGYNTPFIQNEERQATVASNMQSQSNQCSIGVGQETKGGKVDFGWTCISLSRLDGETSDKRNATMDDHAPSSDTAFNEKKSST